MAVLKYNILSLILFFTSNCAYADKKAEIIIENSLESCISVKQLKPIFEKNIPFVKVHYEMKKSVSDCGCKSALLSYSTKVILDGYESSLLSGKFILPKNGTFELPIATSKKLISNNKIKIRLSCSFPD